MDVVEAVGALHVEAIEQAEENERGKSLGRRRQVEEGRRPDLGRQRRDHARAVLAKIVAGHDGADLVEVGGDLGGDVAAVEVVAPDSGKVVERVGEACLDERRTGCGRLAVDQERGGKPGHVLQLIEVLRRQARMRPGRPRSPPSPS